MMSRPENALLKGLISKLETLCDCEVYDYVPQGAAYPYVVIDSDISSNEDLLNVRMERRFVYLSIWSRDYGVYQVKSIIDQIDAINESVITLESGYMVSVRVERTHTNREPDNLTFMGHITLRVLTTH
jgi:hypothetical protein